MSTALDSPIAGSRVGAGAPCKVLEQHLGSSMRPGSRLDIWFLWEKLGELECKVLTETRLEFHATGRFLGRDFDASGKIELEPMGRCTIELGHFRDPDAHYHLQHKSILIESGGFNGHAPSLRFWADEAETKVELKCTVGRFRPRFDLPVAPPRPPTS